ncbi:MAG: hypothetical protein A2452_01670 [Candidatus Firestonebacteria bacterium RIFOXYC2_FULL_39_67]|nr:MAG: hypothetical protein A2452_01670 [Candidatus Firestonebacteria bacterium RIFOXYC2_FULL_39_67]
MIAGTKKKENEGDKGADIYGEYAAENHGGNSVRSRLRRKCGMNNKLNSIRRNSGQPVRQSFLEDKSAEVHIAEVDYQFYDVISFTCAAKSIDINLDLGNILRKLYNDGKVIAAVGEGEAILARAGLLVGRTAAKPEQEAVDYELSKIQNLTLKEGVVVSDRIVTASGTKYLKELVSETARLFKTE